MIAAPPLGAGDVAARTSCRGVAYELRVETPPASRPTIAPARLGSARADDRAVAPASARRLERAVSALAYVTRIDMACDGPRLAASLVGGVRTGPDSMRPATLSVRLAGARLVATRLAVATSR